MSIKRLFPYIVVLFIISVVLILLESSEFECGSTYFLSLQNGNRTILYSVSYLIIFNLAVLDVHNIISLNKFDRQIILRTGYCSFYKSSFYKIFWKAALFNIISNILILVFIHFFKRPISLLETFPIVLAFSNDQSINLIVYLFLSFIGNGLLGCFGFAIVDYFDNKFTYRFFLLLIMLLGMIFIAVAQPVLIEITGSNVMMKVLTCSFLPVGLFSPGMIFEKFGYFNFFTTALFYTLMLFLLQLIAYRRRKIYG